MSPEMDAVESAAKAQMMKDGLVMASMPQNNIKVSDKQASAAGIMSRRPGALWRWWTRAWLSFKIRRGWAIDYSNPDNAPPAWSSLPHAYDARAGMSCCQQCGGGRNHEVHKTKT